MIFTSYAQNYEDVLLWRALQDVGQGCYVDIGAQDPVIDSVSLAFYEAGWRGISVEATPFFAARLREARPDEVVIEAAVTGATGPIDFYEILNTGLSTGKAEIAQKHTQRGYNARQITVPSLGLDQLLHRAAQVHWMKIDVEGMEADVLASWRDSPSRPWVVVVESTVPLEQVGTEALWRHHLFRRGYREAYFDGLSRYFVHESESHLAERFAVPPNVFDGFQVTRRHFSVIKLVEEASGQETAAAERQRELEGQLSDLADRLQLVSQEQDRTAACQSELQTKLTNVTERFHAAEKARIAAQVHAHRLAEDLTEIRRNCEVATHALAIAERDHRLTVERLWSERQEAEKGLVRLWTHRERGLLLKVRSLESQVSKFQKEELQLTRELHRAERDISEWQLKAADLSKRLFLAEDVIAKAIAEPVGRWQSLLRALGLAREDRVKATLRSWQAQSSNPAIEPVESAMSIAPAHEAGFYLQANSLAQLLSLDGVDFVRSAFSTMLGRESDPEGELYYTGRLEEGFPKLQILLDMRRSAEAALFPEPLPGLETAFKQFRFASLLYGKKRAGKAVEARVIADSNATHVEQFMQYYDQDFVRVLYLYYLGREPDLAGLEHHAERLRRGVSRQQILMDVVRSAESRRRGKKARGQRAVAAALRVDRIPLLGTAVAVLKFELRIKSHLQDMRALQNHLYRLTKRLG